MIEIEFHPEATRELEQSAAWYRERSDAAAKGFASAVESAVHKISGDPERFPRLDRHHRACNLTQYPFQVVFRKSGEKVIVIAVAHAKRRPGYWRSR